jgi:glycosyltransferase involved in cell wall biosynthesis
LKIIPKEIIIRNKVLFIAPSAYPLGGVATWLDYLIPGLMDMGWSVTLGLASGKFHNVADYMKRYKFGNIVKIANKTGSREGRIRSIIDVIRENQPDIVAAVNIPDAYAAIERLKTEDMYSPKAVMTIHAIQPDLYDDAREFDHVLDAVICTNRLACKLVEKASGIGPTRIFYAPYGVAVPDAVERLRTNDNKIRIAYSGRIDHFQKRVNDIPKILMRLEEKRIPFEFIIAGGGPAEKDLLHATEKLGLSSKINFLGPLSYNELVQKVYQTCDILLITSFWETGPIVAWEAMSYGLAVVTSNYIGSGLERSLMHGANCLMFPIGDNKKAAQCIESLLNKDLRKSLVKEGYNLVKESYNQQKSIRYWDNAFQKIREKPLQSFHQKNRVLAPAGRLDRLLGVHFAETVRCAIGRKFIHNDPGGEWPHSYGHHKEDDEKFWKIAAEIDSGLK